MVRFLKQIFPNFFSARNKRIYDSQKQWIKKNKHKPILEMLRALLRATGRPEGETASAGKRLYSTGPAVPCHTSGSESLLLTAAWVLPWSLSILLSAASSLA